MRIGTASGLQIAFFTFACMLLTVPVSRWIVRAGGLTGEQADFVLRYLGLMVMASVLLVIPPLRRWSALQLRLPIPAHRRREVFFASIAAPVMAFGAVGGIVAWRWMAEGPAGVAQWVRGLSSHDAQMRAALSYPGLAHLLLLGILGPIAEELIFRGFLYRAWAQRWGWLAAMMLSSLVFALYHQQWVHSFLFGVVFTVLYRRTGTLLAPILVHAFYNMAVSYPLLGQFLIPHGAEAPGDLGAWTFHLVCMAIVFMVVPVYALAARRTLVEAPASPR